MTQFESDVVLGEKYRDVQTGFQGTAIYVTFHQHGCERIALEAMHEGELKAYEFDAPRLQKLEPVPAEPLATRGTGAATTRVSREVRRR